LLKSFDQICKAKIILIKVKVMGNSHQTQNSWSKIDQFLLAKIDEKRQGKSTSKKYKIANTKQVSTRKKLSSRENYFYKLFF
jgi:hypothetical protein